MIEVLKQALEALENSQRFVEASANAKMLHGWGEQLDTAEDAITSLRQAIAELERQEPDKYEMDIECTKCGAKQSGVLTVNTHPPQRKPLTDDEMLMIYGQQHEGKKYSLGRMVEAAHGIKE